jgi:hypothetical protein
MTITQITALQPARWSVQEPLDALTQAAEHLERPCTVCTCRPAAVRTLDVDPDCPDVVNRAAAALAYLPDFTDTALATALAAIETGGALSPEVAA